MTDDDTSEEISDNGSEPMRRDPARARDAKVPPIQLPKNEAHLQRTFRARQTKWVEAQLLADFPKRNAAAPWLADALAFLREAAPYLSGEKYLNPHAGEKIAPPETLIARGKAIGSAGCDDPLFNLILPFLESSMRARTPEQMALAERRLPDLLKGNDTPHIKLFACGWIWGGRYDHRATKDPVKKEAMLKEIPQRFSAALDASATPEDSLGFYQFIDSNQGYMTFYMKSREAEVSAAIAKSKAAAWLKDTLLGEFAIAAAWKARGSGYANTVTAEGWKGFEKHISKASHHLSAAWKANPAVPYAAKEMITVTMAGAGIDGVDERDWFDRSTAACFDYMPAYKSLLWAYRPRWCGSHAQMLAFGKACANTRRYDTLVPTILYTAIGDVGSEIPARGVIYDDPELRRMTVEIERGMIPYAKTDAQKHYALSWGVYNAVRARDYALASTYYKSLKGPILPRVDGAIALYGIQSFEWRGQIAMQSDPTTSSTLQRAEAAYQKGDLSGSRELYASLAKLPLVTTQQDASKLVQHRLAAIAVEERFAKGDWVRLSDEENKLLWVTQTGVTWNGLPGGVLSVTNNKNAQTSRVFLDARVGLDFEVRARLDNPIELPDSQFGCIVGFRPGHMGFASAVCGITHAKPIKKGAVFVSFSYDESSRNPAVPVELKRDSMIRLQSKKGEVTFWVDEKEMFTRHLDDFFDRRTPTKDPGKEQHRFGFGSRQFRKGESRIKNIEFRKLPAT